MKLPKFIFYNNNSKQLDVILHGGSAGIESPFIQKTFKLLQQEGNSVVAFNFPYLDRREDHSSGPELKEEVKALESVLTYCQSRKFKKIRLIGKSLGGIVASYYLRKLSQKKQERYSVAILGYVLGDIDLKTFTGDILIIQGEKDRFCDIQAVKKDLAKAVSKNITFHEVKGADHSFRGSSTKKSVYEEAAVKLLFDNQ